MKKTLSLILALLMSASCAATIFADEAVTTALEEEVPAVEEEVVVESEYDLAVKFLAYKNIMQGKGENDLAVNDLVKRYEMAIFAGRLATGWTTNDEWMNGTDDKTGFTDLEGSGAKDALGVLSYVTTKKIITGYPDGSFKPEATVTYRDALAMVVRTLGYTGLEYPWGIIEKAVTLGLTKDITGVAYTSEITRGVAAQIMYNALFNATTAKGTKLAMDSFGCEYGWENIVVVADDVTAYEIGGKTTKDNAGLVSFKLVEDNGEFGSDVYYVNADIDGDKVADLKFGGFYNALFEIDGDDEYVDMIGSIEYVPEVYKNSGNDADAEIAAYMNGLTIVDKYNVKNLSKDTLYNDEIIVVGETTKEIVIDYKVNASGKYAINWETGDILVKGADGKYTTEWHYNEQYDLYFKWDEKAIIDGGEEYEIAGIQIMTEKELAELKDSIKEAVKATYEGYELYTGAFDSAYAALTVYDFDEDGMGDYAKYDTYKFGTYSGVKAIDGKKGNAHYFDGKPYAIAGSGDDYKAGNDDTYTVTLLTEGYTGYVLYGVDTVANTVEVIKEIPELGKNADEDSYYTYGVVRGVDAANCTVVIGNDKVKFGYDKLEGNDYPSANKKTIANTFFASLFNQYVKYAVVDGMLVDIDPEGAFSKNYIVVEGYYGIDSEGFIVVAGYTTNDLKYTTFRIATYDGYKTGSAFFYNEEELELAFAKGTVYQVLSTDTSYDLPVYNVASLAKYVDGDYTTTNGAVAKAATISFEDNYRILTIGGKETIYKMTKDDKYVVINAIGNTNNYMPIDFYKGIVEDKDADEWTIKGDLLVNDNGLLIFINTTEVKGFNFDDVNTGFIAFPGQVNYIDVLFDEYTRNEYYVLGATTYKVEGFNLLTGAAEKTAAGLNIDIDANKIYATVDGHIIDDETALTWEGFWTAAKEAYADADNTTADYRFAETYFAPSVAKEDVAKYVSTEILGLKREHADILSGYTAKQITLADKNLTKVEDYKNDLKGVDTIKAYIIYDVDAGTALVYFNKADVDMKPADTTKDIAADNRIVIEEDYKEIHATANMTITTDDGVKTAAKVNTITFSLEGDFAADTHYAIDEENFHFGDAGTCTIENWKAGLLVETDESKLVDATKHNKFGTIIAVTYDEVTKCESKDVDCDLVKAVTFKLDNAVALTEAWTYFNVVFTSNEAAPAQTCTYNLSVAARLVNGEVDFQYTVNPWNFCTDGALNVVDFE